MIDYDHEPIETHEGTTLDADNDAPYETNVVARVGPAQLPAHAQAAPPQVFNPLDAPVEQFKQHLAKRQDNYDALKEMLRGILVSGKDFGRIHVLKKSQCDKGQWCDNPRHFSGNQLYNPGADKILALLGLAVSYPGIDDYRQATLRGARVEQVMMICNIIDSQGQVICEGSGAATLKEHTGDLSNTLKKAQKRARLDAALRLPGVSALFEDDYFETAANNNGPTGTTARQSKVSRDDGQHFKTGADLVEMPFGKHKGKLFTQIDENYLRYLVDKIQDKPDVTQAARKELERRESHQPADGFDPDAKPTSEPQAKPRAAKQANPPPPPPPQNDELPPLNSY